MLGYEAIPMKHILFIYLFFLLFVQYLPAQNQSYPELTLYRQTLSDTNIQAYHKALDEYNKQPITKTDSITDKDATVQKIKELTQKFHDSFWGTLPNYSSAFIQALEVEGLLDKIPESSYPEKRSDYARLGEAYYLFNDFEKSIAVLKKALNEQPPLSFTDRADLDARKIIGICYANLNQMDISDYYFRSILESPYQVLDRPVYNAYALSYLGCNAMIRGEYEKALALDDAVLPFFRSYTDNGHLAGMYYCRFSSYFALGDIQRAGIAADSILYYANRDTYHPNKRRKQAFTALSRYNATLGNASLTKAYSDSLVSIYKKEENEYTSQYIANAIQVKHREQAEQAQLEADAYRKNMIIWVVVSIIAILLLSYIFIQYRRLRAAHRVLIEKSRQWADQISESYNRDITDSDAEITEDTRIMQQIQDYVIKDRNYLNSDLNLGSIAQELNINRTYISSAINHVMGKNFSTYINEYRIAEAIRLLNDPAYNSFLSDDLYLSVGFNNKRSFYNNFKKITGIPPGEFIENRKNPQNQPAKD